MRRVHPLAESLDSLGSIAHSVEDCVLLDAAMRGLPAPVVAVADMTALQFVVDQNVLDDPQLQRAVRDNLMQIMDRLQGLGATVTVRPVYTVQAVRELITREGWLGAVEAWELLAEVMKGELAHLIDDRVSARLLAASQISPQRAQILRDARHELLTAIDTELNGAVLVLPTVKHVAPALAPLEQDDELFARTNIATLALTMVGSFLNMPGVAMPSGVDNQGLPTSILFSTPQGFDDQVLAAALAIERALGRNS
jgi:aspartyl-tRNA(Asn)/glutamyl-tRNA(Gln) amidotransferase subunit A